MTESEILEYKESLTQLKKSIISIVSILNKHKKGKILFGIKDNGEVIGLSIGKNTLREISKTISDNIEPKIYPEINEEIIENKKCISITFFGDEVPYFAYGRVYIRVSDEDKKMGAKELENFILKKNKFNWDNQLSDISFNDIDENLLKDYIYKAKKAGRISFDYKNKKDILKKLHLIVDDKLVNASKVLFSNDTKLELQTAVFAGKSKSNFIDINKFNGNIFYLLEESEKYIKKHINWSVKFGKLKREEIPEIPITAIREALVNSFCHRDFFRAEGNKVAIFKDRLEIYNPGKFPEGYKPYDFIRNSHESVLRNPLIANALYLSKEIEKWGSGLKRIYDECKKNNVKLEFKNLKDGFKIIFYRKIAPVNAPVNAPVKLSDLQNNILKLIINNEKITYDEISLELNTNRTTIMRNISKLKELKLLKRIGSDKTGYWKILR
jgi:ATP-dependent DNA helicase RecG